MSMFVKYTSISLLSLSLMACATMTLEPGAEQVLVTALPAPASCVSQGDVSASSGTFFPTGASVEEKMDNTVMALQNKAYAMDANYVALKASDEKGQQRYNDGGIGVKLHGEAYRCPLNSLTQIADYPDASDASALKTSTASTVEQSTPISKSANQSTQKTGTNKTPQSTKKVVIETRQSATKQTTTTRKASTTTSPVVKALPWIPFPKIENVAPLSDAITEEPPAKTVRWIPAPRIKMIEPEEESDTTIEKPATKKVATKPSRWIPFPRIDDTVVNDESDDDV